MQIGDCDEIADCRLQIADCSAIRRCELMKRRVSPIYNLQSAICNHRSI
ncbi:hypothetical protein K2Z83_04800 [Oscillochloris sp. ZM17-4]|nr:hypothetical protein [Oscillochloris sp. ZM17-4]MBX0327000.1 hypothetical protein [Oscillochloris sp. ZM17-4]